MLTSATVNKQQMLTTCQVWLIKFISIFTEFVVCFSYSSLCTVKEILFYLHVLIPVLQQLSFNTFTTSLFLRENKNKRTCTHPGFSLLNGRETFYSPAPCPFQALQLKSSFSWQHLKNKTKKYTNTSKRFFSDFQRNLFLFSETQKTTWPNPASTTIKSEATQLAGGDHTSIATGTPVPRRWVNRVLQYNTLVPGIVVEVIWASIKPWLKGLGSRFASRLAIPTTETTASGRAATATPISAQNHKLGAQNKAMRSQSLCISSIPLAVSQPGASPTGRENLREIRIRPPIGETTNIAGLFISPSGLFSLSHENLGYSYVKQIPHP